MARFFLDDTRGVVWIFGKGKWTGIPMASIASFDMVQVPGDITDLVAMPPLAEEPKGPAFARKRRMFSLAPRTRAGLRRAKRAEPDFDPNDAEAAAKHRELVRAASANSNKAQFKGPQNDHLIQKAKKDAMGIKTHQTAQVSNAQQGGVKRAPRASLRPLAMPA